MSGILSPDFWIFVLVIAGIYTIFALGIQLEFGVAGLMNFGQVAFMAVAAYTMAILTVRFEVPMVVAALAGVLMAVGLGVLLGIPTLRLRSDYLAMATIAAGEIVRYLAVNLQGITGGPVGTVNLLGPGKLASYNDEWLGFQDSIREALAGVVGSEAATRDLAMLVVVWPVALLLVGLVTLLVRAPWGRVLRALREDEEATTALGKNVYAMKMQALLIGSALGGIAGIFLAWQLVRLQPGRLPAHLHLLCLHHRHHRRHDQAVGGAGGRPRLRGALRGHALPRLLPSQPHQLRRSRLPAPAHRGTRPRGAHGLPAPGHLRQARGAGP